MEENPSLLPVQRWAAGLCGAGPDRGAGNVSLPRDAERQGRRASGAAAGVKGGSAGI